MFAGVLRKINDIAYVQVDQPAYNENEVLVNVKYAAICGSDIPRVKTKGTSSFPMILGHEFSGIVSHVGSRVSAIAVGDKVTVYPIIGCASCVYCNQGKPNLCYNFDLFRLR